MILSTTTEKSGVDLSSARIPWLAGWLTLLALIASGVLGTGAEPAVTASSEPQSNRFLLVVETSKSMQRRSANVFAAVRDLLASSMQGQLRPGDTLGVWTFNDEVHTGKLPLQHWTRETATASGRLVLGFINNQTNERPARLEKVVEGLVRVVSASQQISIVLVTSGEQDINGTPFDEQINENFRAWRNRQQAAQQPMLTLLRGEGGRLTCFAVSPAPWPLDMPPLPEAPVKMAAPSVDQPRSPETPAQPPTAPRAPTSSGANAAPSTVPPLIMIGSKSATESATKSEAAPGSLPIPSSSALTETPTVTTESPTTDITVAPQHSGQEARTTGGEEIVRTPPATTNASSAIAVNNVSIPDISPPSEAPKTAHLRRSDSGVASPQQGESAGNAADAQAGASARILILTASAGALVGVGSFFFLRKRREPQASFITQSMDRQSRS